MKKELALQFIDCISKYYKGVALRINLEISPVGSCVVFLRENTPYRVPLRLIVAVQDLLSKGGDFGLLSLSVVRFNDEQSVMVHLDDLFKKD